MQSRALDKFVARWHFVAVERFTHCRFLLRVLTNYNLARVEGFAIHMTIIHRQ